MSDSALSSDSRAGLSSAEPQAAASAPALTPEQRRRYRQRKRAQAGRMRRTLMGAGIGGVGTEPQEMGEDVDPATGLINLADLMLVFACGLMLALVAYWNIDLGPQITDISSDKDMTEVSDIEDARDLLANNSAGYSEVGVVYKDPETGKLYLLTEDVSLAGGDSADGSSTGDVEGDSE